MKKFADRIKDKFDYDVSLLAPYIDEQSPDMLEDLVYSSGLMQRISVQENNKGAEKIKLFESHPALQAASACGWTASAGMILSDKTLNTVRVKIQEEYCNEDLNDAWPQMRNVAGANRQDQDAPFADVMAAYYIKKAAKRNQELMIKGDTASLNTDLSHYDGYVKLWDNDPDLNVVTSLQTSITPANAFSIALEVYNGIDPVLFDNEEGLEVICGRETYRKIIENVYADNNYHHTLQEEAGAEPSFILPTTNIRVRAYQELNGTDKMYAVPYRFMFFGTDLESDTEGFEFKYNDHDEMLRFGVKWRSGVSYVFPQYFTRLALTAP